MKIHYLHQCGGHVLSAPSGATYEFIEDSDGRRVAHVAHGGDADWFLKQTNMLGQPLFESLSKAKTKPAPAPAAPPEHPAASDEPAGESDLLNELQ